MTLDRRLVAKQRAQRRKRLGSTPSPMHPKGVVAQATGLGTALGLKKKLESPA